MQYDETGALLVKASLAGGAVPLEGAVIRIFGADDENKYVEYSLITDVDGITPKIKLPAPLKALSLSESQTDAPYSTYNVEASMDGYYTKKIFNLAIFPQTDSILPINMIPLSKNNGIAEFPKDTLSVTLEENPYLEGVS